MITLHANYKAGNDEYTGLNAVVATFDTIQAALIVLSTIADHSQDYGQLTLTIDSSADSPRPDDCYTTTAAVPYPPE